MYITINDIKSSKSIDLSYPIKNFDSTEIAIISLFSDNIQYQLIKPRTIVDNISGDKKLIPSKTYAGRELLSMLERMTEFTQFINDDQVIKMNKLMGITEMIIKLDELDNSNNLEDGRPTNSLLTYHLTSNEDFMSFKP